MSINVFGIWQQALCWKVENTKENETRFNQGYGQDETIRHTYNLVAVVASNPSGPAVCCFVAFVGESGLAYFLSGSNMTRRF